MDLPSLTIDIVAASEVAALSSLSKQTFQETFGAQNTESDMTAYLAKSFSTEQLLKELHTPGCTFYFARIDGKVIGYMKLNTGAAQSDLKESDSLEIERIYLLQPWQGTGIAAAMMNLAIDIAKKKEAQSIWLAVWEHNYRAIRFYTKFGFTAFGRHPFILGSDVQTDIMIRKMLV